MARCCSSAPFAGRTNLNFTNCELYYIMVTANRFLCGSAWSGICAICILLTCWVVNTARLQILKTENFCKSTATTTTRRNWRWCSWSWLATTATSWWAPTFNSSFTWIYSTRISDFSVPIVANGSPHCWVKDYISGENIWSDIIWGFQNYAFRMSPSVS